MHSISFRTRVLAAVAVAVCLAGSAGIAMAASSKPEQTKFSMFPQPAFVNCVKPNPGLADARGDGEGGARRPQRHARPSTCTGFKPNLDFDLFTIQHSPQTATGAPDAEPERRARVVPVRPARRARTASGQAKIRTILLDQIFGVDKDVALAPTNTFHLGFWFNNPADAQRCGFTGATPFNGEHTRRPAGLRDPPQRAPRTSVRSAPTRSRAAVAPSPATRDGNADAPPGNGAGRGFRRTVCVRGPGSCSTRSSAANRKRFGRCTASTDASCTASRSVCSAGATSPRTRRSRHSCARGRPPIASTSTATRRRGWRRSRNAPPSTSTAGRPAGPPARSTTSHPTTAALVSLPPDLDTLDAVWHVRRAIDALPPEEATIVRMQHLDGMTHTEISEQLEIPLGTVKSRSHRAHRKLAALLGHLRESVA